MVRTELLHNRAKWNIFTVLAPAANTTNIDYEQSLIFLLLTVNDNLNNDQYRVNTQDQEPIRY